MRRLHSLLNMGHVFSHGSGKITLPILPPQNKVRGDVWCTEKYSAFQSLCKQGLSFTGILSYNQVMKIAYSYFIL